MTKEDNASMTEDMGPFCAHRSDQSCCTPMLQKQSARLLNDMTLTVNSFPTVGKIAIFCGFLFNFLVQEL